MEKLIMEELLKILKKTNIEIELTDIVYPLVLNKGQLQRYLGVERSLLNQIVSRPDFPKITSVGKQDRYPRDLAHQWLNNHYKELERGI